MDGYIELTPENLKTVDGINQLNRMLRQIFDAIQNDQVGMGDYSGYGDPEGVVTANIGSTYRRIDGGSSTALYVKEANNNANTGWRAI